MKQTKIQHSKAFKQRVLDDYFSSKCTIKECAEKWGMSRTTLNNWLKNCTLKKKSVPLFPNSFHMDAKDQAIADLRVENARLQREVEYNKLRVAGYERLLEIVKQEDGIDLLKKDGAKQ